MTDASFGVPLPVRIIAIGDELLEGRTADTNSGRIQRALGAHAVQAAGIQVVPDQPEAIVAALDWTHPGDLVFLTGGLGSTPDDLTREAVAGWGGASLEVDAELERSMAERWRRRGGTPVAALVRRQSRVPAGMVPLANPLGSAPALAGRLRERTLVLLPGVPAETEALLPVVLPWLGAQGVLPRPRRNLLWRTAQMAETVLVNRCADIREAHPELQWSWWLTDWGVDMRVAAPSPSEDVVREMDTVEQDVTRRLGPLVFSRDARTPPEVIQNLLKQGSATLAVAESCTAGLLGGSLTQQAGSSAFFRGGILAYADDVKRDLLDVPGDLLQDHGAVSEPVVRAMAAGCRKRLGTDYGLAVTGIAGPGGGSREKPVGTTWIGLATPRGVFAGCYRFPADRIRNRLLTVASALDSLRRALELGNDVSPWERAETWGRNNVLGPQPPSKG